MKKLAASLLAAVCLSALCGCGGGGDDAPQLSPVESALVGEWTMVFMSENPFATSGAMVTAAEMGFAMSFVLSSDMTFIKQMSSPGQPPEFDSGIWSVSGSQLYLNGVPYEYRQNGTQMTIYVVFNDFAAWIAFVRS